MAYISTIPEDGAPAGVKEMYDSHTRKLGYVPNYARIFSHRPEVMEAWGGLLRSIRDNMDLRRFELVTLAAARALRSSYCMLAHGSILRRKFYNSEELSSIASDHRRSNLTEAEMAMMSFAEKIVRDAASMTRGDVEDLRNHGFSDAEIFDLAATAAARCFFSKILDALGADPDENYLELDESLRRTLTVGRPIGRRSEA